MIILHDPYIFPQWLLNFPGMPSPTTVNRSLAVSRLTALWALTEAGLGGVLHAFRTPFTGIFVGGIAVVLILLIGSFSENKSQSILRSLLIVLMVKAAVSPHSPPPAYLAVSFQALMGALLFTIFSNVRLISILLGMLALAESAGQKILTLTILFGESIWDAIDTFVEYTQTQLGVESSSDGGTWVALTYVAMYMLVGTLIGWWAGKLPDRISILLQKWKAPSVSELDPSPVQDTTPGFLRRWWKRGRYAVLILLLFLVSIWGIRDEALLDPIVLILRALCVIVLWYGIVSPIIIELIRGFLSKRKRGSETELAQVMTLLPHLKGVSKIAWEESHQQTGLRRFTEFISRMVVYSISLEIEETPHKIDHTH